MTALTPSNIVTAPPQVPDLFGASPADLVDRWTEVPLATAEEARERAEQIRAGLPGYVRIQQLIADSFARRDWKALDYGSWAEYLMAEFGPELLRLKRADRREAVKDLRDTGMSTRQIAKATGVGQSTVRDDLQLSGNHSPERITGEDKKSHPAKKAAKPAESPADRLSRAGRPVVTDSRSVPDAAAGQDPRPAAALIDTAVGPITPAVAAAMDKHAPDPNPHAEWRLGYLKRVHSVHAVMRSKPEDVAEKADPLCLEELAALVLELTEYHRAVTRAVMARRSASLPDNVTELRRKP